MSNGLKGACLALLAFAIFSTHDAIIKHLGSGYGVGQIMFFAMLFGFPPMALGMSAERTVDSFRPRRPWVVGLRATGVTVAMGLIFYAFTVVPLAEVYAILFATPLLITALSVPLLGEAVGLRRWSAVIVGLLGVLVVIRPGLTELTLGHLAALTGAICNAGGAILVRRYGRDERSAVLVLYPMLGVLAVSALLMPRLYHPPPLGDLGLLAAIGVMGFAGQMLNVQAYKLANAALVAPMQYSQIIWAALYGALFFSEIPDGWTIAGSGIIISSGLYIVWRETRGDVSYTQPVTRTAGQRSHSGLTPDPKGRARAQDGPVD